MANLEEQLTSPESGYQRIDSANINFKLSGNAQIYNYSNNASAYNSTSIYFPGGQGSTTFYVYTSKLYILGISHHNMTAVVNISIDDIDCGTLDLYTEDTKINASNQGQHVQYINTSLAKKVHKVVISTKDSAAIDCIDIDELERLGDSGIPEMVRLAEKLDVILDTDIKEVVNRKKFPNVSTENNKWYTYYTLAKALKKSAATFENEHEGIFSYTVPAIRAESALDRVFGEK